MQIWIWNNLCWKLTARWPDCREACWWTFVRLTAFWGSFHMTWRSYTLLSVEMWSCRLRHAFSIKDLLDILKELESLSFLNCELKCISRDGVEYHPEVISLKGKQRHFLVIQRNNWLRLTYTIKVRQHNLLLACPLIVLSDADLLPSLAVNLVNLWTWCFTDAM